VSEWAGFLGGAGFSFSVAREFVTPIEREEWLARMNVPAPVAEDVRRRFEHAPARVKEAFGITGTHFNLFKAVLIGQRV
jgi:hypothetical protein